MGSEEVRQVASFRGASPGSSVGGVGRFDGRNLGLGEEAFVVVGEEQVELVGSSG